MVENPGGATEVALKHIQEEVTEIKRAFKGDEFAEQTGVLSRLRRVEVDVDTIRTERAAERSEREGQAKLLKWVGASSIFSVLTMLAVIITLIITLQGAGV
jgi:hypothetical protein